MLFYFYLKILCLEDLYSGINDTAENLTQVTAHTDALVVVGVKFISALVGWGNKTPAPDLRKAASLEDEVHQCEQNLLDLRTAALQHLCPDAVR